MAGSIDKVLQSDGTYKWEVVEPKTASQKAAEVSAATTPKETKKKVSKKKTTDLLSD
jgi:hypothetical protein|tara:strand:- start:613 stop:783 length:171 start_codon:yes stop_codon:yes gene_type:complete